jgi:hypothetical protein
MLPRARHVGTGGSEGITPVVLFLDAICGQWPASRLARSTAGGKPTVTQDDGSVRIPQLVLFIVI